MILDSAKFFTHGPEAHATGHSKVEILFALALLIVGITGIVLAFAVKRAPEITEAELMTPTMAIEELTQRLNKQRVFLSRVKDGKEWIHDESNTAKPVRIQPEGKLYWSCRASHNVMDGHSMQKDAQPPRPLPEGRYQIAIFVYRDYRPGVEQPPSAEYTMMVEPKTEKNTETDTETKTNTGTATNTEKKAEQK